MLAALWKGKRFVELGYDAEIRLFEYVLDFSTVKTLLIESGRLDPDLPTTSIHEFLIGFDVPAVTSQPLYDDDVIAATTAVTPTVDLVYGAVSRVRMWLQGGPGMHYAEYRRPDGSIYLRGKVRGDRSMMNGASDLETIGPDGQITGQFDTIRDLWAFWLRYGVSPERPVVIIQDGQFMDADGLEVMSTICTGPNDFNMSVAHGATLKNPRHPASDPVAGWSNTARIEKHLDRMVFLTDEQRVIWGARFPNQPGLVTIPHECRVDSFEYVERDSDRCVLVASLTVGKRVDQAIRAFAVAASDRPRASFEIYGQGPEEENLANLISGLGLGGRVKLMGYAADASERLAGAALSLITSDREAFGMPILESMSRGTPVVSYDIDYGPRYLIRDGVDGYVVPNGNEALLADKMRVLLSDAPVSARLRKAAFERAQDFSAARVTDQWLTVIDEMITSRLGEASGQAAALTA